MLALSIEVRRLRLNASIGLWPEERARPQPILIDVVLGLERNPREDRLNETVSYDDIAATAVRITDSRHHDLIETLAEKIAAEFLALDNVASVEVRVTKQCSTVAADELTAVARGAA